MKSSVEYKIENTFIAHLSLSDLLKITSQATFLESDDSHRIMPLSLTLNSGVFTKESSIDPYPKVAVSQVGSTVHTVCSCGQHHGKLCVHQAEVIHTLINREIFRIFYDSQARTSYLKPFADPLGLSNEPDLDAYFELRFSAGQLVVKKRLKELVSGDLQTTKKLLHLPTSPLKRLAKLHTEKKKILVLGRHRYDQQLCFYLLEVEQTKSGSIKPPINRIDPQKLIWQSQDSDAIKFYSALLRFLQKYAEEDLQTDAEIIHHIVANPLKLDFYYHDRDQSEKLTPKSLIPSRLKNLSADIHLLINRKSPFYQVNGELSFLGCSIPFKEVRIISEYFLFHQGIFYLIQRPEFLRIIKFFKNHNDALLLHESKYPEFHREILDPLADIIHVDYRDVYPATGIPTEHRHLSRTPLIYLQQEGAYIGITPVMRYGNKEVSVYSKRQLFDIDENGNTVPIQRSEDAEWKLTALIMKQHPDFQEQLQQTEYFYLHRDKFFDQAWFLNAFEAWRNAGLAIFGFHQLKHDGTNPYRAKIQIEVDSGVDWFNVKVQIRFGDQIVQLKKLQRAVRNKSKYVELDDGTRGILPEQWMNDIRSYLQAGHIDQELVKIPKVNFSAVNDIFEKDVLSKETQQEIKTLTACLSPDEPIPHVPVSPLLQAQLRSYQQEGLNWLCLLDSLNFGGCLADDMGLGKTLQIIAFLLTKEEKRGRLTDLIVVPTSLIFNWQQELNRFAPTLQVHLHYGPDRSRKEEELASHQIILTTYRTVLSDVGLLKTHAFDCLILDESHIIKNSKSEHYKSLRLLQARNRFVLTGTPVENNSFDLYAQLSFICPGLLGSRKYFKDVYAVPIDKFEYGKRMRALQRKIQPFILRRTKQQVAKELPDKTEMVIYCQMKPEQRAIYQTYEVALRAYIEAEDEDGVLENRISVLAGLTKLRQICNAPFLLQEGHDPKLSIKLEVLSEELQTRSANHKILVFSQFVGMLDLVAETLKDRGMDYAYLTGATKNRREMVEHFQSNPEIRVFLISLKAGGVGLNLTQADYVYLIDPWWNPAAENQAIDRSYRIGQTNHVIAVRLICKDTIEEKIARLQKKKCKLAQDLISDGPSFFTQFSKTDLLSLL